MSWSSATIGELATALSKVQGVLEGAPKSSSNPFFKSKYADLATVWDTCREPLAKNGLAVIQLCIPASDPSKIAVNTILVHTSGEWVSGVIEMKPVKDDPQAIGSAITYARRYGLQAIVGIAPEDDDGNEASGRSENGDKAEHLWPKAKTKAEVAEAKEKGLLKGQRVFHQPIPAHVVAEAEAEVFGTPKAPAWDEHEKTIAEQLAEIPAKIAEKIAAEDSQSMFIGTCSAPGCSAVLVTAKSESSKHPGREYVTCHFALQERAKLRKEGSLTEKEINTKYSHHTRYWK